MSKRIWRVAGWGAGVAGLAVLVMGAVNSGPGPSANAVAVMAGPGMTLSTNAGCVQVGVNPIGIVCDSISGTAGATINFDVGAIIMENNVTLDGTTIAGDGSLLVALNATQLTSGTVLAARMPALTGDITTSAGSVATTLATGNAGNLNSGTLLAARMPALTGDVTTSAGAVATTVTTAKYVWAGTTGNTAIAAATTYFFQPNNSSATLPTADASGGTRVPATHTLTLQNFYAVQSAVSGSAKNITYTVMTNGVASNVTFAINGASALTGNDTTHTVTIVAGVEIGIKIVSDSASGTPKISWGLEAK